MPEPMIEALPKGAKLTTSDLRAKGIANPYREMLRLRAAGYAIHGDWDMRLKTMVYWTGTYEKVTPTSGPMTCACGSGRR